LALLLFLAGFPLLLAAQVSEDLTAREKLGYHLRAMARPTNWAAAFAGAGISQARDTPQGWPQGMEGYARRVGGIQGYMAAQNVFAFTLDSTLRMDPRFRPSTRRGFWPRVKSAALQTLIARTDSGRSVFNYWQVGSHMGAGLLANTWNPDGNNRWGDGLERGMIGLGYSTASNVFREFWPDIRRKVFKRH
jgi:hypothetical protein